MALNRGIVAGFKRAACFEGNTYRRRCRLAGQERTLRWRGLTAINIL